MTSQQIAHFEKLDRFAELLSLDLPIPVIRERMGISIGGAHRLMQCLRDKYGDQAK